MFHIQDCFHLKSAWTKSVQISNPSSCIGDHFQVASFSDQSSKGNTKPFFSLNLKLGKGIRQHGWDFLIRCFQLFFQSQMKFWWITSSVLWVKKCSRVPNVHGSITRRRLKNLFLWRINGTMYLHLAGWFVCKNVGEYTVGLFRKR